MLLRPIEASEETFSVPLWRRAIGGVILGSPSVQDLSIVMIIEGGIVRAYSPQGSLLWEYLASGKLAPFITRTWEGTSYIYRTSGVLIALNRAGLELWKANVKSPLSHAVVIGWDGRIFAPMNDKIACYNNNGRPLWTRELSGTIALPPVLDKNGGLLTALDDGKLLQINAFGKIKETRLAQTPSLLIALFPNKDDTKMDDILAIGEDGEVEIVGGISRFPRLEAPPLVAREYNGRIAIALSNGELLLFSNEGEKLWSVDSGVSGGLGLDHRTVLLHDERGIYVLGMTKAIAFDPKGNMKWSLNIRNATVPPSFGDEGVLYLSGSDWILYAYSMEDARGAQQAPTQRAGKYGLGELPGQRVNYYQYNGASLSFQFDVIRESLEKGQVGEDEPMYTSFLKETAASMRNSLPLSHGKSSAHLQQRLEAVELLELLGSEELTLFLADLFLGDPDPLMKTATADAIGIIGVDREGWAMKAFSQAVKTASSNEQYLFSLVKSVGAICRRAGPLAMREGVPILAAIRAQATAPLAQRQAVEELQTLQY
jgi:outer membrane protein assembly factor BamB